MSEPRLQHFDHRRDVARIVLQIAVRRDDVAAARVREAGGKCRGLAEVAAEPNDSQPRVGPLQRRELRKRVVGAAVVDREDLVTDGRRPGEPSSAPDEAPSTLGDSFRIGMTTEISGRIIRLG